MSHHALPRRVLVLCCLVAIGSAALLAEVNSVGVQIKAAVVDADLTVKPVPKQRFEILPEEGTPGQTVVVTTSFNGECRVTLAPGRYRIRSSAAVTLGSRRMQWDVPFEVRSPGPMTVELSNDNALAETAPAGSPGRPPSKATEIFQALRDAVVTIEAEGAQGSGFLVDSRGLLVTNEHVVSGSRFFIASLDDDHRLPAHLVVSDPTEDIAVLMIHPKAAQGLPVIALAADAPEEAAVREGDPVFAIGSPLHQQKIITAGIVSKVEQGAIISDVMIDHGNSGGPLLNVDKEAVGINTFGEGRGVSGTVRIWKARPVVEEALKKIDAVSPPSADFLPPIPKTRFPADAMKQAVLVEDFDLENYHLRTRRFEVFVLTPPALCYFEHQDEIKTAKGRQERRKKATAADTYDPVADIKGWAQYVGDYRATVRVVIVPRIKPTFGSALGAGLLGSSAVMHYRYQGDVDTLRLIRNGKEIQPIRIGREPVGWRFAGPGGHMEDVAYWGFAEYLPEAFEPPKGAADRMVLEIVNEAKAGATTTEEIQADLLGRIWQDFAPLRGPTPR